MYTTKEEFKNYFQKDFKGVSYESIEDIAVNILDEYAGDFPTEEEYQTHSSKSYLKKAILYQIKYIDDNMNYFFNEEESIVSIKVGRVSKTIDNKNIITIDSDYSDVALTFLRKSGICITTVSRDGYCC